MGKSRDLANLLADSAVGTTEIADDAITSAKILNGAVTSAKIGDSQVTDAKISAVAATKLTGTVPTARLGSGTADSTTYLRGDGSWQTISTTPTTDQVLTATAGASVGAVGTYVLGRRTGSVTAGSTYAGSGITYSGIANDPEQTSSQLWSSSANWQVRTGSTLSGTWRAMGTANNNIGLTLYLRIS